MRVEFLEDVPVDIDAVPPSARGALGIRHARKRPQFVSLLKDKNGLPIANSKGEPITVATAAMLSEGHDHHYFRKGWQAELPDEMAAELIEQGKAKVVAAVVFKDEAGESKDETSQTEDAE